jgi:hypothetical protein
MRYGARLVLLFLIGLLLGTEDVSPGLSLLVISLASFLPYTR